MTPYVLPGQKTRKSRHRYRYTCGPCEVSWLGTDVPLEANGCWYCGQPSEEFTKTYLWPDGEYHG